MNQLERLLDRLDDQEKNDVWEESYLTNLNAVDDPLRKASFADIHTWLPNNLLTKLDRMTMLHSIEGRCPFLSKNLIEYVFHFLLRQRLIQSRIRRLCVHLAKDSFSRKFVKEESRALYYQ